MANSRTSSAAPRSFPAAAVPRPAATAQGAHRIRAVDPDETVPVAHFLPPVATWLPAPQHSVPSLPGRPAMVGYLVLVPAGRQPPFPASAAPDASAVPVPVPRPPVASPVTSSVTEHGADRSGPGAGRRPAGPVHVDTARRTATVGERELDLTYLEFELLAHLVAHPHRVHTRDQLVTTVWGYGHVGDGRTVDVHVARLRRKLGAEHRRTIQTVRRVGYRYAP
ncbi:winged helix-turn-helix domain-containing protein [Streptomyces sp. NPDC049887]|uniref:winged helix-turn-helix domain-containing protein n=1 Tax=unclassified Streptomyces TaxID=2593676 RepID=UPI00343F803F